MKARSPSMVSLPLGMVVAAVILLASPSAADATSIKVNAPGNDPRGVELDTADLGGRDVNGISYPLQGNQVRTVSGWSLARVLTVAAGRPEASGWLDASRIPSVTLSPPSNDVGAQISVSSNEILDQGIFGGGRTPVFEENADGTIDFIKPGVNGSPGAVYRYSVSVEIRTEREAPGTKRLRLRVSPKAVEKGGRVSFEAIVPGRDSIGLAFSWTIREVNSGRTLQSSTREGSFSRTFQRVGSYRVLVDLIGNSEFEPASASFTVGKESRPSSPKEPPDSATETASGSGYPGFPGSLPPGASGAGFGSGAGGPGSAPSRERAEEPDPRNAVVPDDLERVSGVLIDPAASASAVDPEAGGAAEDDPAGDGAFGLSGEAATLFGVGLLIALGGLIEARILFRRF